MHAYIHAYIHTDRHTYRQTSMHMNQTMMFTIKVRFYVLRCTEMNSSTYFVLSFHQYNTLSFVSNTGKSQWPATAIQRVSEPRKACKNSKKAWEKFSRPFGTT